MNSMKTKSLLLALATILGCGPSSKPTVIPTLPGDGNDNTAKPVDVPDAPDPDPWTGRTDLIATPAAREPSAVKLPAIERFKLRNGLSVIVVKSDRLPVVGMQLAVKAGRADVSRDKVGVEQFAASMLTRGTKTRDALSIAKEIDFVGGSLGANSSYEATLVSCAAMAKDLDTCLTLLPDVVVNATFPEAEMDEIRQQLHAEVRQRLDDAGQLASAHFQNLLWGDGHVRGWPMSPTTIDAITRKDLQDWHKAWFKPSNAVLAVAGDVDTKALKKSLEKSFSTWRNGKVTARKKVATPELPKVRVRLVDKPKQTQTHIRIGHFGIAHADKRFYDSMVWNYTLGGGAFSSRLMKVVRSEGGKTYGASSSFDRNLDVGSFVAATFTRNAEALATANLVSGEMVKMAEGGVTDSEVSDAIANLAGSYATRFESATDIAGAILAAELHGLGDDYVRNFPLDVAKVTPASATKAATEILDPTKFVVVFVGDAKDLKPQLDKMGWAYETVNYADPIGKWEREPADGPADPKAEKAGRALLDKAIAAKGGKAAIGLKSFAIEGEAELTLGPQTVKGSVRRVYVAPGKTRMDLELTIPGGTVKVVTAISGKTGWAIQPGQGLQDLPAEMVESLTDQMWRDQEMLFTNVSEKGTKVVALGDKTVEGVAYDVVKVTRADDKVAVTLFLDKTTHLLGRMEYVQDGVKAFDVFGDYKAVNGVQFAHARLTSDQQTKLAVKVTKVEVAPKIEAGFFDKPAK